MRTKCLLAAAFSIVGPRRPSLPTIWPGFTAARIAAGVWSEGKKGFPERVGAEGPNSGVAPFKDAGARLFRSVPSQGRPSTGLARYETATDRATHCHRCARVLS